MSEQIKVTRKSKVGFGYETSAEQVWNESMTNSWLEVIPTTNPYHIGTPKKVLQAIEADRHFQSLQQGTYYTIGWFVKIDGKWRKFIHNQYASISDLFEKNWKDELPEYILIEVE